MSYKEIIRGTKKIEIETPEIYVDNEKRGRSGHMTHAMAEFAPGCFIDFNSNCSASRVGGHSPYGWVEYRISEDCGKTYSDINKLPYSVECFEDGIHMISVEKAVCCDDGTIVAFCLRNAGTKEWACEPWDTPVVIRSCDGGKTWSEPLEYSKYAGRTYGVVYHKGIIYAMHFCNEEFLGKKPEHVYRIYKSTDNGKSFKELCIVPFETEGRGYCNLIFDNDDKLHAYAYNVNAESMLDHAVSLDFGENWEVLEPCYLKKFIRNPQLGYIDGIYVLHGRAGLSHLVLYTSEDLTNWDAGTYIVYKEKVGAFYSNNLNLTDENGNFLLIQYSDAYDNNAKVNVMHTKLRVKDK